MLNFYWKIYPLVLLLVWPLWCCASDDVNATAVHRLVAGNQRFAAGNLEHLHQSTGRRIGILNTQEPFAMVLTCSDSRVPPEIIFDAGLGDLFTMRVAGNVLDAAILGTIEYGAEHLNIPLVLVLGHTGCGAVQATLQGDEPRTHIESLIKDIRPAVREAAREGGNLLDNSVRDNVRRTVKRLRTTKPIISKRCLNGKIQIVGAIYHMDTGLVELLPDNQQTKLAGAPK